MSTRILKPWKSSVTTAKINKRTQWTAQGESAHTPHRLAARGDAPRLQGALPWPVLKAMPCSSYCKGSIRCFFDWTVTVLRNLPTNSSSAASHGRLITFPAAGWTVHTADNKNSLGDGSVIAFAKFFLFLYTWSFQCCFSWWILTGWHLHCF